MALLSQRIARIHKILGLVIGLQFVFWTASGFFFTLYPIDIIRGDHLSAEHEFTEINPDTVDPGILKTLINTHDESLEQITLRRLLDRSVYQVDTWRGVALYDAMSGEKITPISEPLVREIAKMYWIGEGVIESVSWVEEPPREAASYSPLWRVDFTGAQPATYWIDPNRASIRSVRTGKWRLFDVLWRFHIMDITGEDEFDTWWLKLFAVLGLTTVLFGIALLVDRALKGRLLR